MPARAGKRPGLLPLTAAAVHAQNYAIKIKTHAATGSSFPVAESVKVTIVYSVAVGGNVLKDEKKVIREEKQYTEKVLQADDMRATKFTRTYSKAVKSEDDGDAGKPSYVGKTVTFDDHNSAGRFVVLQTVVNKKVGVADIVEVK